MGYNFSPIRFAEYQKIDSVVDINSIEVNLVKPIKMGNVQTLGPSNSTCRHLLKKTVIQLYLNIYINMFIVSLFVIVNKLKKPKYINRIML